MRHHSGELRNTNYELFIATLSLLSVLNIVLITFLREKVAGQVAFVMDGFFSVIFLADFAIRLLSADSKSKYFFRQFGWADLLGSLPLPQLKLLRLFRLLRVTRGLRAFGSRGMLRELLTDRAGSTLLSLLFLIILILEFGSMAMISVESRAANATIANAGDAIWYTFVTITTVGYGDTYPVTNAGRLIGFLIMSAGVALFGTLTGYLANLFLAPRSDANSKEEAQPVQAHSLEARLVDLKALLQEQKRVQAELEDKITEIEMAL
jgi:voltage-gated potassium channel